MIASYFVSMAVTPVACRYFLGHAEHGRVGKAVEGFIDRLAEGYSRVLREVLPYRWTIVVASVVLVVASGVGGGAAAEHVLPRDRRVDGHDLRPLLARHLDRATPRRS